MKMKKTLTTAMILGTISLSAGLVIAYDLPTRGPAPFTTWDADGSGTIDQQEFNTICEQRQAMAKSSGRMGRNMANAPSFAQIDTDGDGTITVAELTVMQQGQRGKQGMGWHHGNGQAMTGGQRYNNGGMGMGRGHHGGGQGMTGNMGPRHQAMDAETREKYDAFFVSTTELRKEMAVKRAEKQAVMRGANPDPDQAAQLTRELLELRARMQAQAEDAGIQIAQCRSNRHGGMGHGGGARW